MSRTKIVATIGPASRTPEIIRQLLHAGMTVARINFSHGDHATHTETVRRLRRIAAEEAVNLAILGDLQGPKIRVGNVRKGGLSLSLNDELLFTPHRGQPAMIHLPHPELFNSVAIGARLVIGDGEVEFKVIEKKKDILRCLVTVAGKLESRKGINVPNTDMGISSITAKDREDLRLICDLDLDFAALSFVRHEDDIRELRELMRMQGNIIPIIAKIEKNEAITRLEEILQLADGMMVARGDLGIEAGPERVPSLQKKIIKLCNKAGKPVITATQMLQSMVHHPQPTRAESSDVANAILDGTDALMLSGETAAGHYPVEAVAMMHKISLIVEEDFPYTRWRIRRHRRQEESTVVTEAISIAVCGLAEQVEAAGIVCSSMSGFTARQISRYRPETPILAVTPSEKTRRQLALTWGVDCLLIPPLDEMGNVVEAVITAVHSQNIHAGKKIVITAGVPFGQVGQTNLIQVHTLKRDG